MMKIVANPAVPDDEAWLVGQSSLLDLKLQPKGEGAEIVATFVMPPVVRIRGLTVG